MMVSECCQAALRTTTVVERDGCREAHVRCTDCDAGGCILRDPGTGEVTRRIGPAVNLQQSPGPYMEVAV